MVLVPLGVSMDSWTRSMDPKSKSRSANETFTDDTGAAFFTRVGSTSHGLSETKNLKKLNKSSLSSKNKPKMVSPVQQILEQTKDKEKRSDAPDTVPISFNVASTSTGVSQKNPAKRKPQKKKVTTAASSRTASSTIKRLKRKRNSQSKKKLGTGKKSSTVKKTISAKKKGKKSSS